MKTTDTIIIVFSHTDLLNNIVGGGKEHENDEILNGEKQRCSQYSNNRWMSFIVNDNHKCLCVTFIKALDTKNGWKNRKNFFEESSIS